MTESEENLAEYESNRAGPGRAATPLPIEQSIEYAPQIIHSIETSTPRVVYGNVENAGLIENLPQGACVEVPCLVDGTGVRPMHVGELPPQLAALNRTFLNVGELTVRAALDGRPDHVLQAALLDPNTAATLRIDQIEDLVADRHPRPRRFVAARPCGRPRRAPSPRASTCSGGTTVVVGAAQGIGAEIAERLSREDWVGRLVLADIKADGLRRGRRRRSSATGRPSSRTASTSPTRLGRRARRRQRRRRAGGDRLRRLRARRLARGRARDLRPDHRGQPRGLVLLSRRASPPRWPTDGGGAIVGVASIAARMPRMRQAAYCASKAGMRQGLRVLGMEVAGAGVRINTVSPGATDTPMMRALAADHDSVDDLAQGTLEAMRPADPLRPRRPHRRRRGRGRLPARPRGRTRLPSRTSSSMEASYWGCESAMRRIRSERKTKEEW